MLRLGAWLITFVYFASGLRPQKTEAGITEAGITVKGAVVSKASNATRGPNYQRTKLPNYFGPKAELDQVVAGDMFGLHDLLLLGASALVSKTPDATAQIQEAVITLVNMLGVLHPVAQCRATIDELLTKTWKDGGPPLQIIDEVAQASWACLGVNADWFEGAAVFDGGAMREFLSGHDLEALPAKNPQLTAKGKGGTGTCALSKWPRTCSYWVLLHTMVARAEIITDQQSAGDSGNNMGFQFLGAWITIIFGGATVCKGCQRHFRLFHEYSDYTTPLGVVPDEVVKGTMDIDELVFSACSGPQCSKANEHMNLFMLECWWTDCANDALAHEKDEMQSYHTFVKAFAMQAPFALSVVVHNIVTTTVNAAWVRGGGRYACVRDAASALQATGMLADLIGDNAFTPRMPQARAAGIPLAWQRDITTIDDPSKLTGPPTAAMVGYATSKRDESFLTVPGIGISREIGPAGAGNAALPDGCGIMPD